MNKFLFVFGFLLAFLFLMSSGFADFLPTPFNPYKCEYFFQPDEFFGYKLDVVLSNLGVPIITNLSCESKITSSTCNAVKGCNWKSNGQCKPYSYCNTVNDCPTSKIISKDLLNVFLSLGALSCSDNMCQVTDYTKCSPKTSAVSFVKEDILINTPTDASNFTNLTGIKSLNIINFCDSVFPGSPFGDMMSDTFCDLNHYGDRLQYPNKTLIDYWGKYFLVGQTQNITGLGGRDMSYQLLFSGYSDLYPVFKDNNIYSCSPNMFHINTIDNANQITTLVANNWDSVILNANDYSINYKSSSCNNYSFSCPCTPNGNECYLQGCGSNTDWLCNPKKSNGTSCNLGKGTCQSGACVLNPQCTSVNQCTGATICQIASCNNSKQCVYSPKSLGTSCGSGLGCDGASKCIVPIDAIAPSNTSFCKFDTSKQDDNHIVCTISQDNLDFNIDTLDLDAIKSKHKIEINYTDSFTFTLVNKKYSDLNYYIYGVDSGKLKLNTNMLFEQQNFSGGFVNGGTLDLISGGKFKQMKFTMGITVTGLRSILDRLSIVNDANVWIQGMTGGSTIPNVDIIGTLRMSSNYNTIITNLNLYFGQLILYSYNGLTNRNLMLINSPYIMYSNIDANKIELNNVNMDITNSTITNLNSPVTLYANGSKASFRFIDFSGLSKKQKYILDSVGDKDNNYVLFIDSLSNGGKFSFDLYPVKKDQNGTSLSYDYYVKVSIGKDTVANLDLNFNSSKVSGYNSFYNLATISDSNNVIISGPDYMYVQYLPKGYVNFYDVGANVTNLKITNLKYYSPNTSLQIGSPIYTQSPITLTNSIINNAQVAVTYNNYAGFSLDSKMYSNSFSNNKLVFGSRGNNHVYFFNNFLKDNNCILNDNFSGNDQFCNSPVPTKLKWYGLVSDTNNSFGPNSICNNIIQGNVISNLFLDYNRIPMFYYSGSTLVNEYYSPICYGGNLYYEKQKALGCTSNCFEDGLDHDFVAEIIYNGYDHSPLIYSLFNMFLSDVKDQYDLAVDENIKITLRFFNYSKTNYNTNLDYTIFKGSQLISNFTNSFVVVSTSVSPDGVGVFNLYKLSDKNITTTGTYTIKVVDEKSGVMVQKDFNVIDSTMTNINLSLSGINDQYDLVKDKLDANIIFDNKTNYNKTLDYTIQTLDSDAKVIFFKQLNSFVCSANFPCWTTYYYPNGDWNTVLGINTSGTYTFKVIETKSGLTAEKTFTVIDSSIKIKTVKTPDNSIYVIAMLVAVTIGFLVFKNRN